MRQQINKEDDLFSKIKESIAENDIFCDWLVEDGEEEEKHKTLHDLWSKPSDIISEDEILSSLEILKKRNLNLKRRRYISRRVWTLTAVAASVMLFVVGYTINTSGNNLKLVEHYTSIGENKMLVLPDGSEVQTNSSTLLVYAADFGKENREIYLVGQANFKVTKNEKKPFIVKSNQIAITALGTEFNVSSYATEDIISTTLLEGKIKVESGESDYEQILAVGEKYSYNKTTKEKWIATVDLEDATAWQRGELVLRGATLTSVLEKVEQKYKVVFYYREKIKNNDTYNISFKSEATLPEVMEIIKSVAEDFDYKIEGNSCYIY